MERRPPNTQETPAPPSSPEKPVAEQRQVFLQVGVFSSPRQVDEMRARLALAGLEPRISTINNGINTMYRIRLGPYQDRTQALTDQKRLQRNGITAKMIKQ